MEWQAADENPLLAVSPRPADLGCTIRALIASPVVPTHADADTPAACHPASTPLWSALSRRVPTKVLTRALTIGLSPPSGVNRRVGGRRDWVPFSAIFYQFQS